MAFPQGIPGQASFPQGINQGILPQGQGANGMDGSGGGLLAVIDLTASDATAEFVDVFGDELDEYEFSWVDIQPATDDTYLGIKVSTDGGSTWLGGSSYCYNLGVLGSTEAAAIVTGSDGSSIISLTAFAAGDGIGNATAEGCDGRFYIAKMSDSANYKHIYGNSIWINSAGDVYGANFSSSVLTTTAINGVQFSLGSGNFNKGKIKLRGKKAVV